MHIPEPNTKAKQVHSTSAAKWIVSGVAIIFLSISLSALCLVIVYRWVNPPLTWLMVERYIKGEKTKLIPIEHKWIPIDSISKHMMQAVVAAEDNLFMEHYGFDFKSIREAQADIKRGKRVRGASTISMQVSKNAFLWHGKTMTRKALEAGFTILIETFWSKQRIMEVYLNIAEFGPSIYGVEAASRTYFKKSSQKLTRAEAAMLAAVLPNPLHRNPKKPTAYMYSYQQRVLRNMNNIGPIDIQNKK